MLRINLLRIEGTRSNPWKRWQYLQGRINTKWNRLHEAWTAWIRQNFTVEERVNTKLQAVAHELTKMQC